MPLGEHDRQGWAFNTGTCVPPAGQGTPHAEIIFLADASKTDKNAFFLATTFDFGGVFGQEGARILKNRGQKMYAKFNFLQDGTIRERLSLIATELQPVCEGHPPGTAAKVKF